MERIDLHMHSTVSDGTDTPAELLRHVREAGITLFALTDHDAVRGCAMIRELRTEDDPKLVTGVEFSCRDEEGKYHILGYRFDPDSAAIREVVDLGHRYRMEKTEARIAFLRDRFGFTFTAEDTDGLLARIEGTMAENPAAQLGKGDVIAAGVSKELDELRHISRGGK